MQLMKSQMLHTFVQTDEVRSLYKPGHAVPYVGNRTEEQSCVSTVT
jgi:hypothetical protein